MDEPGNHLNAEDFLADRLQGLRPGVVVCVINKDFRVLFGLNSEHGIWEMPQGGIKEGENLIDALKREIKQELGEEFLNSLFILPEPLVAIDQVLFPEKSLQGKKLAVNGKEIPMAGKKYYFCLVAQIKDMEPKKIEHADFKRVLYEEGKQLVGQIPQKGKKRILLNILEILKENGFIK